MWLRRPVSIFVAAAALGSAPAAHAHGGIPRAYSIYFEPGNPDHIVLRSSVWGLFRSQDGGETWSWICAESYGDNSMDYEHRPVVVLPGGTLLVAASFSGLQIARDGDLCNFAPAAAFEEDPDTGALGEVVQDVAATRPDGSLLHVLTSTGSQAGVTAQLWISNDQGATWERTGTVLPGDASGNSFTATSFGIAPSDEQRVYVAGKYIGLTENGVVQRSDDGGQTWEALGIPVNITDGSWTGRIAGVHPSDSNVVYFWMDRKEEGGGDIQPDELWLSTDGAQTWNRVYEATGNLPGFAFSPDASTVAIAGPEDGLLKAPALGGGPFQQEYADSVWGLTWTETGLYAGNNDFTPGDLPKFTFGVSQDEGKSFEGLMQICQADKIACDSSSRTGPACEPKYSDPGYYRDDYLDGPRCVAGVPDSGASGAGDGGVGGSGGSGAENDDAGDDGCGCTVPGRGPERHVGALVALAVVALRRLRRRSAC